MSIVERIIITTFALLSFALANLISKECEINDERLTCHCDNNQEFSLSEEYNYENVTSLNLSSCSTATLDTSFTESNKIEELVITNIGELLTLEVFLHTDQLKRFELTNIKKIPYINHDLFSHLHYIEHFEMRNVHVDYFEEEFIGIKVDHFVMANVTISNMKGFNFSEHGETLQISDCEFRNASTLLLNFGVFSNVEIVNSKFELQKPGRLLVESNETIVRDNFFFNVSMNLVAAKIVKINNTCADDNSSLRIFSNNIESFDNKLPTTILYKGPTSYKVSESNNTICKADPVLTFCRKYCQ
ncbi:uncharacterized protein LOC122523318 [Polistes fuscatus]|uniref:uncharacterized protein LOC122523318 n=1 Tax=Polistes fuscatus TaxID=30207 RepID=UPI001CA91038|nr:uncharacterized protein LOC122523318 [Polistes fuscatus]